MGVNMSLHVIFKNELIKMLPRIKKIIIEHSESAFLTTRMLCAAVKQYLAGKKSISEMTKDDMKKLEDSVIEIFRDKGWID